VTIAEKLRSTFLFEHLSGEQLAWLAERTREERHPAGAVLFSEGQPATDMWVLLEGQVQLTKRVAGDDVVLVTSEQHGAYLGAIRSFVRASGEENYGNTARLQRDSRLLRIPAEAFAELLETHFPIAMHLLDGLFLGVRNMEALVHQREKLVALGALSAGLAHELNNPAAAGRRAAGGLRDTVAHLRDGLGRLGAAGVQASTLTRLAELGGQAAERARDAGPLSSMEASDREDELGDWLERRGVGAGWQLASTLVEAGLDSVFLEQLEEATGPTAFEPGLRWIVDVLTATSLVASVEESTHRISELVGAVKDYTWMDRAAVQEVDVHDGLESTLTMLRNKLKQGVEVQRDYDRDLPRVRVYPGELNQVWTNLIDNAVDAMDGHGTLRITTGRDGPLLLVEVRDSGPGIPATVQPRIFEPFFTTKDVGQGTGLGLDISYRIVHDRHHGSLTVTSTPGDTRFQVRIPLAGVATT
jgi:signal transduction histidine kinase